MRGLPPYAPPSRYRTAFPANVSSSAAVLAMPLAPLRVSPSCCVCLQSSNNNNRLMHDRLVPLMSPASCLLAVASCLLPDAFSLLPPASRLPSSRCLSLLSRLASSASSQNPSRSRPRQLCAPTPTPPPSLCHCLCVSHTCLRVNQLVACNWPQLHLLIEVILSLKLYWTRNILNKYTKLHNKYTEMHNTAQDLPSSSTPLSYTHTHTRTCRLS